MTTGYIRLGFIAISSLSLLATSVAQAKMVQGEPITFYGGKFQVSTETDDRLPNANDLLSCFQEVMEGRFASDQQRIAALQKVNSVKVVKRSNGLVRTGRTIRKIFTFGLWKGKPGKIGPSMSGGVLTIVADEDTDCAEFRSEIKNAVNEAPKVYAKKTGQDPDGLGGSYVAGGMNKPGESDRYVASLNNPVADITAQAALDSAKQGVDAAALAEQNTQARVAAMGPHADATDQQALSEQSRIRAEAGVRYAQAQKGYHEQRLQRARDVMRSASDPNSPTFQQARQLADESKAAIDAMTPAPVTVAASSSQGGPDRVPTNNRPGSVHAPAPATPTETAPVEIAAANEAYPVGDQNADTLALKNLSDQKKADAKALKDANKAMAKLPAWSSSMSWEEQKSHRSSYMQTLVANMSDLTSKQKHAELDASIADKKVEALEASDKARIATSNGTELSDDDIEAKLKEDADLLKLRDTAKKKHEVADTTKATTKAAQTTFSNELVIWADLETAGAWNHTWGLDVKVPGQPDRVVQSESGFLNAKGYTWNSTDKIWVFTGYSK